MKVSFFRSNRSSPAPRVPSHNWSLLSMQRVHALLEAIDASFLTSCLKFLNVFFFVSNTSRPPASVPIQRLCSLSSTIFFTLSSLRLLGSFSLWIYQINLFVFL